MLYIIIIILVILLICASITYNSLVKLYNRVKEAFSTMDVYLKKRWDLIPNIVETVKVYSKQEKDIHDKKVDIHVSPVVDINDSNLSTTDIEKQKLIKEFEGMSKEMKLLILENILKKMW